MCVSAFTCIDICMYIYMYIYIWKRNLSAECGVPVWGRYTDFTVTTFKHVEVGLGPGAAEVVR